MGESSGCIVRYGERFFVVAGSMTEVPMSESSDRELLDLIRRCGPLTVVEMGGAWV